MSDFSRRVRADADVLALRRPRQPWVGDAIDSLRDLANEFDRLTARYEAEVAVLKEQWRQPARFDDYARDDSGTQQWRRNVVTSEDKA